jgi:hypothetical protein
MWYIGIHTVYDIYANLVDGTNGGGGRVLKAPVPLPFPFGQKHEDLYTEFYTFM